MSNPQVIESFVKEYQAAYAQKLAEFSKLTKRQPGSSEKAELRRRLRSQFAPKYSEITTALNHFHQKNREARQHKPRNFATPANYQEDQLYMLGMSIERKLIGETIRTSQKTAAKTAQRKQLTATINTEGERQVGRYMGLVNTYGYVPSDHVASRLLGIDHWKVVQLRETLQTDWELTEHIIDNAPEILSRFWTATPKVDETKVRLHELVDKLTASDRSVLVELLTNIKP